jgi:exonuclease III
MISCADDIKKMFLNNPYEKYDFFFNSSMNKRGVGILLKKNKNFVILEQLNSEDENAILLRTTLGGTEVILISIYGPNSNDPDFFNNLCTWLNRYNNIPFIIAGDWNATYSPDPIENNPDIINMQRLPNLNHSIKINDLCNEFNLSDPFRFFYPERREFTYVPRNVLNHNKSRLDFFLVSDTIMDTVTDCDIALTLQNKLFDHKAVLLDLNKRVLPIGRKRQFISNPDLDDELLTFLVHATVAETYLLHGTVDRIEGVSKDLLLNSCGVIKTLIRECGPPLELRIGLDPDPELIRDRERKIVRIQFLINSININALELIPLSCSDLILMETLLLNLKNEVTSHQKFMRKVRDLKKLELIKKIRNLKANYTGNIPEINDAERMLDNIIDAEIRSELERYRTYDILNTEKMCPRFLTLAKAKKNSASLDNIKDDDGQPFASEEARDRYITSFYQNIYTPHPGNMVLNDNSIENFLGEEICNNPICTESKLTAAECAYFDRVLSLEELDKAVEKLNSNSAGGLDGIPTKFLKKFWAYLRVPLLKYAQAAINTGTLTQTFNSAGIKLIPKKGDISQMKNWRPISLLNSVFKIIAKAVDFRLQKINEIVLSRGQKGFTSNRQLHECIINIVETISYANHHNIPSFVLALDMAKAFDTVRHDYMNLVYKFFGLGNNLIKMINTISTGRSACIIKEDGTTTAPFRLSTGFPQGNPPSPNQFNLGEQILILKFELDPRIQPIKNLPIQIQRPVLHNFGVPANGVPALAPVPVALPVPVREFGIRESGRNTEKIEAFADDNNVLAKLDNTAMLAIKNILNDFGMLSGLRCNVDKSQILLLGTDEIPDYVANSGFAPVTELKILGFTVTKNYDDLKNNITPALDKISKCKRFWDRYRLSLPGRINVAKTLMLSQIGFHSAILDPDPNVLHEIQNTVNKFITGNFRFDKNLITASPNLGGLGMINICDYIKSLHCSWVKKAARSSIDNWRVDLRIISGTDPVNIEPARVPIFHPILKSLSNSFRQFKDSFFKQGKNFLKSNFYGNPCLVNNKREKVPVKDEILHNNRIDGPFLPEIKIKDLLADNLEFLSMEQVRNVLRYDINLPEYERLKICVTDSLKLIKKFMIGEESLEISNFLKRFKKGSKPFRRIFDNHRNSLLKKNKRTETFFRLVDLPVPEKKDLDILNSLWTYNKFPMRLREFIFKFRNNLLGLNTRVSHFNANVRRHCTFCTLKNPNANNLPDESFEHLFFSCPHTKKMYTNFFEKFTGWDINDNILMKKFIFNGSMPENTTLNFFVLTVSTHINFYIWQCKLQKKLPVQTALYNEIFYNIENIRVICPRLRDDMYLNLPLCRNWAAESSSRG